MKLFITNKGHFEEHFDRKDYRDGYYYTSQKIHQIAFNELQSSLADGKIPLVLSPDYKDDISAAIFEFKSKKGDIYFYEFTTTAS